MPYIPELKRPRWHFILKQPTPDFFLPRKSEIQDLLVGFTKFPKPAYLLPLQEIFWTLWLKKYLNVQFTDTDYEIGQRLIEKTLIKVSGNDIGFSEFPEYLNTFKKKQKKNQHPGICQTYYAIGILYLLGKLPEFLNGSNPIPIKQGLKTFLSKLIQNNKISPCIDPKCKVCSQVSQEELLFYILTIWDLINLDPRIKKKEWYRLISIPQKGKRNLFRLLDLLYLGLRHEIKEEDLLALHQYQKTNGGFTFQNSAYADDIDSFWISITLDSLRWLLPYRPGPIYAFLEQTIINRLNQVQNSNFEFLNEKTKGKKNQNKKKRKTEEKISTQPYIINSAYSSGSTYHPESAHPGYTMGYSSYSSYSAFSGTKAWNTAATFSPLIIAYGTIWHAVIDELEDLIFQHLEDSGLMDLNVLSLEGGVRGSEETIIQFINEKYQITLEIKDNAILFKRFLNHLDPFQQKFAPDLLNLARTYTQFDLSEYRKNYNKGKRKDVRIKDEFLISLINQMMAEHFFYGTIFKKSRIFKTTYYFIKDTFIDRVLISNKRISLEQIRREKKKLEEVQLDIYNMTREMKTAAEHIHHEVESLIIAGEVELAEQRLTLNIKKALFDASFFNKTIENFPEEFEYIRANHILKKPIEQWKKLYQSLQSQFSNVKKLLSTKISALKEEQQQYSKIIELEHIINSSINEIGELFEQFAQRFRTELATANPRKEIPELINQQKEIKKVVSNIDEKIRTISLQITNKKPEIVNKRKKLIDQWISQLNDFNDVIKQYERGFEIWEQKVKEIDNLHQEFVEKLERVGNEISNAVQQDNFERALQLNNQNFPKMLMDIERYTTKLEAELEKEFNKQRLLNPISRALMTEWLLYQNVLEKLTQQMRDELQETIQIDLRTYQIQALNLLIDKSITQIREQVLELKNQVHSKLQSANDFPKNEFDREIKSLLEEINRADKEIEKQQLKIKIKPKDIQRRIQNQGQNQGQNQIQNQNQGQNQGEKEKGNIDNEDDEINILIEKWNKNKTKYHNEIEEIINRIKEEQLLHKIVQTSYKQNKNVFSIDELAKLTNIEASNIKEFIQKMILDSRINAQFNEKHDEITFYNRDWREFQKLKQKFDIQLHEIDKEVVKVENFFNQALLQREYLRNLNQIQSLSHNIRRKIFLLRENLDQYIQDKKINTKNQTIHDYLAAYYLALDEEQKKIDTIEQVGNRTEEYRKFLKKQYQFMEDMVHSEIHRLYNDVSTRNMTNYKKNVKWFENQQAAIERGIKQIEESIEEFKKQHWAELSQAMTVIIELEQTHEIQKKKIRDDLETAKEDILEKLSYMQLTEMRKKMEGLIQIRQEVLTKKLQKMETEIHHKLQLKDFKGATARVITRTKQLEKDLRETEKQIKAQNKNFTTISKIFGIKYQYLIEKWELFLLDFLNSLQAKQVELEKEIVEEYIHVIIGALKEDFIPLNRAAKDLNFKHDLIQHRIMTLIGEKRLSGKIDMKYDIYIEGDEDLSDETIASLDIIRSTNVKTYLFLQRLANIFKILGPLLTAIGSMLTITWYLSKFTSNFLIILTPFIILAIIVIILWIKKGKDKALGTKKS